MYRYLLIISLLCAQEIYAEEMSSLLTCSGNAKATLSTSLAEVRLGVELEGHTAEEVEKELSSAANRILSALKSIQDGRIESTTFQVNPEYSNTNPPVIKAFRGKGEFSLTLPKERAGEAIKTAFQAGANRVGEITLKAKDSELDLASDLAIQKACQQAMQRAITALNTLHLEVSSIHSVDIQINPPQVQPWRHQAVNFAAKSDGVQLEGVQEIEAQAQLKVLFKPIVK